MADFRKSLLLAAMTLAVGVGTASAQCTGTTGVPPLLRNQGVTELTGLISITCPSTVEASGGIVNFTIQENATQITSLPVTSTNIAEPFLIVTGPDGIVPGPATGGINSGTVIGSPGPNGTTYANTVVFDGVTLPAGGFTIVIGGIRINATTIPISVSAGIFSAATATVSVTNGNVPLLNPNFTVGYVVPNAVTAAVSQVTLAGATACSTAPSTVDYGPFATITIAENPLDADAFKPQFPTSTSNDSESGTNLSGNSFVPSTTGTQFAVGFVVPSGLTFYVPVTIVSSSATVAGAPGGGTATLVTGSGSTTVATPTSGAPADGLFALTGTGTVFYNVVNSNATIVEAYSIPVYPVGTLSTGEAGVEVALAPIFTGVVTQSPEFTGLLPTTSATAAYSDGFFPVFGIGSQAPCQTSLLFPFMTNQAGFDTGFSIAYTGTDPFGTVAVTNGGATPSCTLYFYGDAAPTTPPSALTISTGFSELHSTISSVAPGFQGYMIAQCNFIFGHGYAFITDGFMGPGRGLSEGYVANVIGDGQRAGTPSTPLSGGQPEILGH